MLHDASVRIGTTLDVTRTAEELVEVTVPRFADLTTRQSVFEPVLITVPLRARGTTVGVVSFHRTTDEKIIWAEQPLP